MILADFKDFPRAGRLLGIDWGRRRIGLAVSDERQEFLFSRPRIDIGKSGLMPAEKLIAQIAMEEKAAGIVVGLPVRSDGSDSETTKSVRRFAADLAACTDLPIVFMEENLTSVAAGEKIKDSGIKNADLDSESAAIILENAISMIKRLKL
ncbi:MAG: Holliday junction resolvase RuvX [Rickettsiales bacterium]|jgi:putative Holliday junction resolvase|nr:Holliday junction resolvase RuvX [Rickettsiales bacterium]